jgi:hypothetical protein
MVRSSGVRRRPHRCVHEIPLDTRASPSKRGTIEEKAALELLREPHDAFDRDRHPDLDRRFACDLGARELSGEAGHDRD